MKIITVLRDKAGISLIFVLAVMLLLMAIGVSAITAAGYNYGAGLAQRDRNQLELYTSSMERTIHSSLLKGITGETILSADSLRGLILRDAYLEKNEREENIYTYSYVYNPDINLPDGLNAVFSATVMASINVQIFPPVEDLEWVDSIEGPDGSIIVVDDYVVVGRSPEKAYMHGWVKVTLNIRNNAALISSGPLGATTETTYSVVGAVLLEQYYDYLMDVEPEKMFIDDPGIWTVSRHEKTGG